MPGAVIQSNKLQGLRLKAWAIIQFTTGTVLAQSGGWTYTAAAPNIGWLNNAGIALGDVAFVTTSRNRDLTVSVVAGQVQAEFVAAPASGTGIHVEVWGV